MAAADFEKLAGDLPDGAMWITGAWLKTLIAAIRSDRATLDPASGDESATTDGRVFTTNYQNGDTTTVDVLTSTGFQTITFSGSAAPTTPALPESGRVFVAFNDASPEFVEETTDCPDSE